MPSAQYIGLEHVEAHTMRLLGSSMASQMKSSAAYFGPGDVLYGRLRPYLNKVYRPHFEGLASAEFIVFPKRANLEQRYLQYFLNSCDFVSFASRLNAGDRPRVDFGQLGPYPFPLPPLLEQQRIVAEIEKQFSRIDAAVASLQRVRANLKRYGASVLKAACQGRLVPTEAELARREGRGYEPASTLIERILKERRVRWESQQPRRGKHQEPKSPDTSNLPPLPEGWEWASLDQLLFLLHNGYSKRPDGTDGTPILRISAVRPMSVDMHDVRYVASEAHDLTGFLLSSGDLLFTRYNGNPSLVGVCGMVPGTYPRQTAHPDKLIRGRIAGHAIPGFIEVAANTGLSRSFLSRRIRTTAGQYGVSGSDLRLMPVPLPPVAEQRRVVVEVERRMTLMQATHDLIDGNLKRAARLRQSILQRAFQGRLVSQDSSDEPAFILLQHIQAERDGSENRGLSARRSEQHCRQEDR